MAGSGTGLAENVPETLEVKLPMLVPTIEKPGTMPAERQAHRGRVGQVGNHVAGQGQAVGRCTDRQRAARAAAERHVGECHR